MLGLLAPFELWVIYAALRPVWGVEIFVGTADQWILRSDFHRWAWRHLIPRKVVRSATLERVLTPLIMGKCSQR